MTDILNQHNLPIKLSLPITAQLEITDYCNFRCRHCYLLDSCNRKQSKEDYNKVMRTAELLAENKVFNVILTGGEPLSRPRLLKDLICYLTNHNVNVGVNTNLSLLTPEILDTFEKYKIRSILVSCPSGIKSEYEQLTGLESGFEKFEANIKALAESELRFSVNMVVTKENKNSIIQTAEFLKSCGVNSFAATPMSLNPLYPRQDLLLSYDEIKRMLADLVHIEKEIGMSIDVMEALPHCAIPEQLIRDGYYFTNRKCQAGITVIAVSKNGDVRPCTHNVDSYGNLLQDDLREIWKRMEKWRDLSLIPEKCKQCSLLARCHGGCRVNAKTYTGQWDGEDVWMQHPVTASIEKILGASPQLTIDTVIRASKGLKHRDEGNGYTLVCVRNPRQVALVSNEVYRLLCVIGQEPLSLGQALGITTITPELKKILRHLIERQIIEFV